MSWPRRGTSAHRAQAISAAASTTGSHGRSRSPLAALESRIAAVLPIELELLCVAAPNAARDAARKAQRAGPVASRHAEAQRLVAAQPQMSAVRAGRERLDLAVGLLQVGLRGWDGRERQHGGIRAGQG